MKGAQERKGEVQGRSSHMLSYKRVRRKGLCLKCGEMWGHDHVCKPKHYHLVLVEGSDEEIPVKKEEESAEEIQELEMRTSHISFNSLKGFTSNKSLKVLRKLGRKEVVILIKTRAIANFISKSLAQEL